MHAVPQLRPATPADDAFLRGFPFVQHTHAEASIIALPDSTPVGRLLLVHHHPDAEHILDLTLLPDFQHQGLGTCLLRELQRQARDRGIAITADIPRGASAAQRLFERHGFHALSNHESHIEMRWQAPQTAQETREIASRIIAFLREIGLHIQLTSVPYTSFLPGLELVSGGLNVDLDRLLYAGDLLHEAGHLSVLVPSIRLSATPTPQDGDEAAAMAWSWAAALHLGLPADVVFHDCSYRGHAAALRASFANGDYIGLPLLGWMRLTTPSTRDAPSIYPQMLRWLREEPSAA